MSQYSKTTALVRAVVVMGAVMSIVSGVTFAALQSQQAVLAGNSISTASADLKISTDGTTFTTSGTGFSFANIIPGGSAVPAGGNTFYLKNSGSTNVSLKMAISNTPTNTSNVDLTKVSVIVTRTPGGSAQTFTMQQLMDTYATGGTAVSTPINTATTAQFSIQVSMTSDAFSGPSATLGNINIVFTGTAIAS